LSYPGATMLSMSITPYRRILALPLVQPLLSFAVLARLPAAAASVVLTVHVVAGLGLGYGAAGLVAAVWTVGTALGSPGLGRAVDRFGLRRALLPSVVVETAVWTAVPFLDYRSLLAAAFVGGLLSVPIFTVVRQSLAVLVPAAQQRVAFTLDSIGTEVTFMIGPALGVVLATQWSGDGTLLVIGAATAVAGLGLMVFDPPTRSAGGEGSLPGAGAAWPAEIDPGRPVRRGLLRDRRLLAVLAATVGALVVLAGTDVSVVAHVRSHHEVGLTWLVFVTWSLASMAGGLVYGAARRAVPVYVLLLALGLFSIPIGFAPNTWWLTLAIMPAGFLCAPALSATAAEVSRLVPEQRRGEAMGWYGSALTLGIALGTPLAGSAIDLAGPWAGFAAIGGVGMLVALIGLLLIPLITDRPGSGEPGAPSGVSPTRRLTVSI
jgi:MFS family permease